MAYEDDVINRAFNGGTLTRKIPSMLPTAPVRPVVNDAREFRRSGVAQGIAQPGIAGMDAESLRRRLMGTRPATGGTGIPLLAPRTPEEYQARNPVAPAPVVAAQPVSVAANMPGVSVASQNQRELNRAPVANIARPALATTPASSPVAPSYAVGGASQATQLSGQPAQQAIAAFDANPTAGSGYATMGGRTTMIAPRAPPNVAPAGVPPLQQPVSPSGVTPQDFQAATARAASDKAQVAQLEAQRNVESLQNYTPPPLNLSGGIGELAASVQARRQGRKMQTQGLEQAGREQEIAQRGTQQQQQNAQSQAFQQPLRDAQTDLTKQNIAKGAQEAQQRVQVIQLRQQILAEKDPGKRRVLQNKLAALGVKPEQKFQILKGDGLNTQDRIIMTGEDGMPTTVEPRQQAAQPLPPKDKLVVGETYPNPKGGMMIWRGTGFEPVR